MDGLGDLGVIRALAEKYHLHPLAIEDVLHVPQRPEGPGLRRGRGATRRGSSSSSARWSCARASSHTEQVSIFVGHQTVLTFQETPGDVWDPIRQRIRTPGSRLRRNDASFLAYSLIDAVVDQCLPDPRALRRPARGAGGRGPAAARRQDTIQEIHRLKRELLLVRRAMWPMREVLQQAAARARTSASRR